MSQACMVHVASPLRSYTHGKATVAASGGTLQEVLADLESRFPGIRFRMIDEQDRIRRHMQIFINTQQAKGIEAQVSPSDEVHLICALSGG